MRGGDTSLGGRGGDFPVTTWSMVLGLGATAPQDQQAALDELARRYWKPVYRHIRIAWARTNDDAKDLTQEFFSRLAEGGALARYRSEKGGFRAFLKMLLNGVVANELRDAGRLKRGGGRVVSLDGIDDAANLAVGADERDADAAFDRAWVAQVVGAAVARVRKLCAGGPRETAFRIFEDYDHTAAPERPTYDQLAAAYKITPATVDSQLSIVRRMIRDEIRAEVARLTADDRDREDELRGLFGF